MAGASLVSGAWGQSTLPAPTPAPASRAPTAGAGSLRLEEVLRSVAGVHPDWLKAQIDVARSDAVRLTKSGFFDPKVKLSVEHLPSGYYEYTKLDAEVNQATPFWGLRFSAGYRFGRGRIPSYSGELETLTGGEARAGLELPLLKGGAIDPGRAELRQARQGQAQARCEARRAQLKLARAAARAYWVWVAAGQQARVAERLLRVAEVRDAGLRDQVALGSLPAVVLVDNQRQVLERRSELLAAQGKFQVSTVELSLYFRAPSGDPIVVDPARLPAQVATPPARQLNTEETDVRFAIEQRPELCIVEYDRQQALVEVALRKNERAPELTAGAFVARDVGNGSETLVPAELGVGVKLALPVALRAARGKLAEARAKLRSVEQTARAARDRVRADVVRARLELSLAEQQVTLASAQVSIQNELAEAERERFRQGASDLLRVNLREQSAASSEKFAAAAKAEAQLSWVALQAALGRLPGATGG